MPIHTSKQGFQKGHGLLGNNPTSKGKHWKLSEETKRKMSDAKKKLFQQRPELKEFSRGNLKFVKSTKGIPRPEEVKIKISMSKTGVKVPKLQGKNHFRWIDDRTKLVKRQERNDVAYKEWRKSVWSRDGFKCKIESAECEGRIEAHHILGWREYSELRYELNNGITLCHFHHPRKRKDEKRLSPYFQDIINISN